jgi:hypothetical protein
VLERDLRDEVRRSAPWLEMPAGAGARLQVAAQAQWHDGEEPEQIARSLGISAGTVRRWCHPRDLRPRALVPVQIVEETVPQTALQWISAGGWRLEGLDLARAVWLLRRLR